MKRPSSVDAPASGLIAAGVAFVFLLLASAIPSQALTFEEKAEGAIAWAQEQVGSHEWDWWCARFVANAYGADHAGGNAIDLWYAYAQHAEPWTSAPRGALVFWRYASLGHVGIYEGDGRVVHAYGDSGVAESDASAILPGAYLGWTYPSDAWPGREGSEPELGDGIGVGEREDHTTDPLIVDAYNRNGGAAAIGSPTNYVHQWGPGSNGWIQDFDPDKAITHKTQHTYAVYIQGAIWDLYKTLSGPWSSLGWPLHDAVALGSLPVGDNYHAQQFELGYDGWISDVPYWGDVTHDGIVGPIYDSYDQVIPAGGTALFQLKVKNYGQDTWPAGYVGLRIKGDHAGEFWASGWSEPEAGVYIAGTNSEEVPPQGTTIFSWYMHAPAEGVYSDVQAMLYSLDGQCYVPHVMAYTITVGSAPGAAQVGEREDGYIDPKFVDCYNRNGGAAAMGAPTSYVEAWGTVSPGWVQHFGPDKAILRKEKSYALAAYTYGTIWQLYTGLGGPDGSLDWPYWKDTDDPYYSNTGYPVQDPPGILDHPFGPVYQSYMVQNFIDTTPWDGWICEAPFWGDKTHDGLVYPFDTYDPVMVAGQTERFRMLVKNYGQETWQPGYVMIRIKGTYAPDFQAEDWWQPEPDVYIAGSVDEAVPPQGVTMLEWNMKAPAAPGIYGPGDTDLTVMLYSLYALDDGDYCYVPNVMHYHITVIPATPGPDYAISELRRTDGSGDRIAGDTIDLAWETRNQGSVAGGSTTTTTIYLSADATIDAGDTVLYEDTVPSLPAGESQARTATITIPSGILPPGAVDHQFHIGAICDTDDTVAEINEGNNVAGGARLIVTEGSTYTLTIAAAGDGTVSGVEGASGVAPKSAGLTARSAGVWQGAYSPGTPVSVEALRGDGQLFLGWNWDHEDTSDHTTIAVEKNTYVTATFAPIVIFVDVPLTQWAATPIASCYYAGIVQGYTQDDPGTPENEATYAPGVPVARDQMAVYISRALAGGDANVPAGPGTATFDDVPTDHWAFRYVEYCYAHDVVEGFSPTTYGPDAVVDRAQMAVYVARAVAGGDASVPSGPANATFGDVPTDHWAFRCVEYCHGRGIVQGYDATTYAPDGEVTRDQMAVYVARAFELPM